MVWMFENWYYCEWCLFEFEHVKHSKAAARQPNGMAGRHRVTADLECPNCGRVISQRSAEGRKS
jgi:hypothetical protein